ncbi:hypothetical protein HanXRQr2_Chr16g0747721 [Helianthus annuus]|uniref:Uncharacterized protein n=1 Tax=Helianthus annuus TaxID=4232 RepID=A0A9K3GYM0_HELAN|nr:hypothetical protein HanXRQr2_Chr16g0747721 [Helianthus annuus]KAJ0821164.1 hypothetical protein HanPSC8_Chr16g0716801 [Helianthus annuus]
MQYFAIFFLGTQVCRIERTILCWLPRAAHNGPGHQIKRAESDYGHRLPYALLTVFCYCYVVFRWSLGSGSRAVTVFGLVV